jgi:hypothetical protein
MIMPASSRSVIKNTLPTGSLLCGIALLIISPPAFSGIFQSDFPVDAQTVNPSIHIGLTGNKIVKQDGFPVGSLIINPLGENTSVRMNTMYSVRNKEESIWRTILSSAGKTTTRQSSEELPMATIKPSYKYQLNTDTESHSVLTTKKQKEVTEVIPITNRGNKFPAPYTTELIKVEPLH